VRGHRKRLHGNNIAAFSAALKALGVEGAEEDTIRGWEAGAKMRPETRDALAEYFQEPAPVPARRQSEPELVAALAEQTEAMTRQAAAIEALVAELRQARSEQPEWAEAIARAVLAAQQASGAARGSEEQRASGAPRRGQADTALGRSSDPDLHRLRPDRFREATVSLTRLASLALIAGILAGCSSTPAAPLITGLTITSPVSGSTVSSSPITVQGQAPPSSRVVQDISLAADQQTFAGSQGNWVMSVELSAGANVLTFRLGDDKATAQSITVTLGAAGAATATPAPVVGTPAPVVTVPPPSGTYATLTKRQWSQLVKSPDDHIGEQYVVWACITQFDAATGTEGFRGDAYFEKDDPYWLNADNAVFTGDAGLLSDFVTDDVVKMNVSVAGAYTYDTSIGGSATVPSFSVVKIEHKGDCG
jgi:hypothetical protein